MRNFFRLRAATHLWMSGMLAATAALGFSGCSNETEGGLEGSTCVSTQERFALTYFRVIQKDCASCHNPGGVGYLGSEFKLTSTSEAGFLDRNLEVMKSLAELESDGKSVLLQKPLGNLNHGGNTIYQSEDDPGYKEIEKLVQAFKDGDACPNTEARFLAGLQMMGPADTFRKAALTLGARLPTAEEQAAIETGGWPAVDALMDNLLKEKPFYERLKDRYNDLMLTDFYLNGGNFNVISDDGFYNPQWYDDLNLDDPALIKKYGAQDGNDLHDKLQSWTREAVARGTLELIAYVVRNDMDFRQIATMDSMVVNPFSARAYNMTDVVFDNDADPTEFKQGRLGGYDSDFPHAGIMTDPIWLSRHPTTDTNRNRHRAREVLYLLLGNDILKAAERPLDVTKVDRAQNPTVNDVNCAVCHTAVDPMAAGFRNFQRFDGGIDSQFAYQPDSPWFDEMWLPGFRGTPMPPAFYPRASVWMGEQIANDSGFAFAAVFMAYRTIVGNEPLQAPKDPTDPNFEGDLASFLGQYYTFSQIATNFQNNGYNFKAMVKELIMSPYFRAMNSASDIDPLQLTHLSGVGSAHLLTPEQLDRKVEGVLGMKWRRQFSEFGEGNLLNDGGDEGYKILFGGIDSEDTTVRITSPNGIMANVMERMGAEMGCRVVAAEFSIPREDRKWLKNVDPTTEPQDANLYDIPANIQSIKTDIQAMHEKLLGEKLDINDPEITRTYNLFLETWKEGKLNIVASNPYFFDECRTNKNYITGFTVPDEEVFTDDSLYTGRAWMTVLAYMLSDYAFVYE
ncbi:MAG: hypothetical protein U0271_32960 [Polyangiaceae bacterium]